MLLFYQTEISFLHFLLWQTLTTADDEIMWGSSVLQKNNFIFFFPPTWLRIRKQKMVKAWEMGEMLCGSKQNTSACSDDIIVLLSCVSHPLLSSALSLISCWHWAKGWLENFTETASFSVQGTRWLICLFLSCYCAKAQPYQQYFICDDKRSPADLLHQKRKALLQLGMNGKCHDLDFSLMPNK